MKKRTYKELENEGRFKTYWMIYLFCMMILFMILFLAYSHTTSTLLKENEMLKGQIKQTQLELNECNQFNWSLTTRCNTSNGFLLAYFISDFKFEKDYFHVLNRTITNCEVLHD